MSTEAKIASERSDAFLKWGAYFAHGPHQVAQNLTTTSRPDPIRSSNCSLLVISVIEMGNNLLHLNTTNHTKRVHDLIEGTDRLAHATGVNRVREQRAINNKVYCVPDGVLS